MGPVTDSFLVLAPLGAALGLAVHQRERGHTALAAIVWPATLLLLQKLRGVRGATGPGSSGAAMQLAWSASGPLLVGLEGLLMMAYGPGDGADHHAWLTVLQSLALCVLGACGWWQAWRAWTSPGGRDAHHPQLLGSLRTPRSSANGGPAHQPLASKPGLGGLDTPPRGARGAGLGHPLLSGSSLIGTDVAGGPLLGSSAPGTPTRGGAAAKSLAGHHLESSTSGGAPPPPPLPWGAEGAGAELRGPLLSEHDVTPRAAAAQPSGEQPGDGAGGQGGAETPPPPECQDGEEGAEAAPDGEEAPMESPADLMLEMLGQLLNGHMPDLEELKLLHSCLAAGHNIYTPLSVQENLATTSMDADVEEALMQRLLGVSVAHGGGGGGGGGGGRHGGRGPSPVSTLQAARALLPGIVETTEVLDLEDSGAAAAGGRATATSSLGQGHAAGALHGRGLAHDMRLALSQLACDVSPLDDDAPVAPLSPRRSSFTAAAAAAGVRRRSSHVGQPPLMSPPDSPVVPQRGSSHPQAPEPAAAAARPQPGGAGRSARTSLADPEPAAGCAAAAGSPPQSSGTFPPARAGSSSVESVGAVVAAALPCAAALQAPAAATHAQSAPQQRLPGDARPAGAAASGAAPASASNGSIKLRTAPSVTFKDEEDEEAPAAAQGAAAVNPHGAQRQPLPLAAEPGGGRGSAAAASAFGSGIPPWHRASSSHMRGLSSAPHSRRSSAVLDPSAVPPPAAFGPHGRSGYSALALARDSLLDALGQGDAPAHLEPQGAAPASPRVPHRARQGEGLPGAFAGAAPASPLPGAAQSFQLAGGSHAAGGSSCPHCGQALPSRASAERQRRSDSLLDSAAAPLSPARTDGGGEPPAPRERDGDGEAGRLRRKKSVKDIARAVTKGLKRLMTTGGSATSAAAAPAAAAASHGSFTTTATATTTREAVAAALPDDAEALDAGELGGRAAPPHAEHAHALGVHMWTTTAAHTRGSASSAGLRSSAAMTTRVSGLLSGTHSSSGASVASGRGREAPPAAVVGASDLAQLDEAEEQGDGEEGSEGEGEGAFRMWGTRRSKSFNHALRTAHSVGSRLRRSSAQEEDVGAAAAAATAAVHGAPGAAAPPGARPAQPTAHPQGTSSSGSAAIVVPSSVLVMHNGVLTAADAPSRPDAVPQAPPSSQEHGADCVLLPPAAAAAGADAAGAAGEAGEAGRGSASAPAVVQSASTSATVLGTAPPSAGTSAVHRAVVSTRPSLTTSGSSFMWPPTAQHKTLTSELLQAHGSGVGAAGQSQRASMERPASLINLHGSMDGLPPSALFASVTGGRPRQQPAARVAHQHSSPLVTSGAAGAAQSQHQHHQRSSAVSSASSNAVAAVSFADALQRAATRSSLDVVGLAQQAWNSTSGVLPPPLTALQAASASASSGGGGGRATPPMVLGAVARPPAQQLQDRASGLGALAAAAKAEVWTQGGKEAGGGDDDKAAHGKARTPRKSAGEDAPTPGLTTRASGGLVMAAAGSHRAGAAAELAAQRASTSATAATARPAVSQRASARRLAAPAHTPPPPAALDRVEALLAVAETACTFDTFELAEATQGHPLSCLAFFLMARKGLIEAFSLDAVKLARWLRHVESGYRDNPYHNCTHAADVLQTMHVTLHMSGMMAHYVDSHMLLCCYLAAAVHDYEHQGLTNDYLVNTSDVLAIRYNDKAPMENHHLAAAFTTMRHPAYDFTADMPRADYMHMRKVIIELVLATDMKQHFALVGSYNSCRRNLTLAMSLSGVMASNDPTAASGAHALDAAAAAVVSGSAAQHPHGALLLGDHVATLPSASTTLLSMPHLSQTSFAGAPGSARTSHSRSVLLNSATTRSSAANRSLMQSLSNTSSAHVLPPPSPAGSGAHSAVPTRLIAAHALGFLAAGGSTGTRRVVGPRSSVVQHAITAGLGNRTASGNLAAADAQPSASNTAATNTQQFNTTATQQLLFVDTHLGNTSTGGFAIGSDTLNHLSQPFQPHPAYTAPVPLDEAERMLSIQIAFKCSDLGHIAEGRAVHLKWVAALEEEFFRQGDRERAAGLPISPLFDRTKPGVTKSQVGFFEVVAMPLFKAFVGSFPGARPLMQGVYDNCRHWKQVAAAAAAATAAPQPA